MVEKITRDKQQPGDFGQRERWRRKAQIGGLKRQGCGEKDKGPGNGPWNLRMPCRDASAGAMAPPACPGCRPGLARRAIEELIGWPPENRSMHVDHFVC
jgi:hypothetical protein